MGGTPSPLAPPPPLKTPGYASGCKAYSNSNKSKVLHKLLHRSSFRPNETSKNVKIKKKCMLNNVALSQHK